MLRQNGDKQPFVPQFLGKSLVTKTLTRDCLTCLHCHFSTQDKTQARKRRYAISRTGLGRACRQFASILFTSSRETIPMSFSIESKLGDLLDNETTKAVLEKHMPGISTHPQIGMGKGFALSMVAKFSGGMITDEMLANVDADLKALG
jgi:hypothetical protein